MFLGIVLLAGAAVVGLSWAYRRLPSIAAQQRSETDMTSPPMVEQKQLPPIDVAAPTEVETATFALG